MSFSSQVFDWAEGAAFPISIQPKASEVAVANRFGTLSEANMDIPSPEGESLPMGMECPGGVDMVVEDKGKRGSFEDRDTSSGQSGSSSQEYVPVKSKSQLKCERKEKNDIARSKSQASSWGG